MLWAYWSSVLCIYVAPALLYKSHCACLHFVVFRARPLIYLAECQHYCTIGEQLRSRHLMDDTLNLPLIATFDVAGSNKLEYVKYDEGKVWINATQYFNNVPQSVWDHYVGAPPPPLVAETYGTPS